MMNTMNLQGELELARPLTAQPYGICNLSVVPIRAEPSDKSEMTTQLLFGESFEVLESLDKWSRIRQTYDGYEGWIDNKQFFGLDEEEMNVLGDNQHFVCTAPFNFLSNALGSSHYLSPGCTLPAFQGDTIFMGDQKFYFKGNAYHNNSFPREHIERLFRIFLNAPYLWGGRSILGIDCSGFTQVCFKILGIRLLRDASQQAAQGLLLNNLEEGKLGDLAFFDNPQGRITHVGILLNNRQIIHASGKVRVDTIDDKGIFREDLQAYSHQLKKIKRVI